MHIVTDRLVLREFVIGDWPAVLAYQRDPRYLRFYPWINRKVMKLDLYCDDPSHAQKTQTYLNLLSCTLSGLWVGHLVLALLRIGESIGFRLLEFVCTRPLLLYLSTPSSKSWLTLALQFEHLASIKSGAEAAS
jgi:RimJ/RimL family protein N-acetyltransferase